MEHRTTDAVPIVVSDVGLYSKDRIISGLGVLVPVLIAAGSLIVVVLIAMRVQEKQIAYLEEADTDTKAYLLREIAEAKESFGMQIEVLAKELEKQHIAIVSNREHIAKAERELARIKGALDNFAIPWETLRNEEVRNSLVNGTVKGKANGSRTD